MIFLLSEKVVLCGYLKRQQNLRKNYPKIFATILWTYP